LIIILKDTSETFQRSFYIILAYGLAFGLGYIARLIGNPTIPFNFYVSEQEISATYQINLKDLMDIILIGPVFTVLSFILIKRILDGLDTLEDNKIMLFYIIFLLAIVLFNYGNISHITMNRLNADIVDVFSTPQVYYSIYFIDEFIGHHLETIGFFIVLSEICVLHTLDLQERSKLENYSDALLRNRESFWNYILGIGLGIGTAFAYLEGQCAFLFLILNPILCTLVILQTKKYDIKLKENGLLIMILLMTIAFMITVLVWGILTGIKPFYPFFYQNSEVDIF